MTARHLGERVLTVGIAAGLAVLMMGANRRVPDPISGTNGGQTKGGGALDTSFAGDGTIMTFIPPILDPPGYNTDVANAVAIDGNGRMLVAGFGTAHPFALERYNADGTLDTTFGTGGLATFPTTLSTQWYSGATCMVVQPDGRILVGGGLGFFYAMARFMPDGSLDPGFGQDGVVQQSEPRLTANGMALLPDGRIVLAGGGFGYTLQLSRYESNGLHDDTFGTNGVVDTGLAVSGPFDMAQQADGRFVFVFFYAGGFTLVRLDSDGSLDAGFGSGGIVNLPFFANAVVVRPDGKIFVGGSSGTLPEAPPPPLGPTIEADKATLSSKQSFEVRRFNPDGSPDESFGKKGLVTTSFYDPSTIQALALDAQGRLVAAGNTVSPSGLGGDFALARYQPDGSPDRSFGKGGRTIADVDGLGLEDSARAIAVQPDGRLVVVGFVAQQQADLNNSLAWGLARFLP